MLDVRRVRRAGRARGALRGRGALRLLSDHAGRQTERGTEESNLELGFWRPTCYHYTSPPSGGDCSQCGRRDSNPQGLSAHRHLKPARLPVPPRPRAQQLLRPAFVDCMFRNVAEHAEEDRDVIIDHPNRDKASSKATKAIVVLLLLVSAGPDRGDHVRRLVEARGHEAHLDRLHPRLPGHGLLRRCAGTAAYCPSRPRWRSSSASSRPSPGPSGSSATRPASRTRPSTPTSSAC